MKLRECTHGVIVQSTGSEDIGMIVGITNNVPASDREARSFVERAVPLIQWAHGETSGIHPSNIELYTD